MKAKICHSIELQLLRESFETKNTEDAKKGPAIKLTLSLWLRLLGSNQRQAD
ncbi:MAG: hypothetical protein JRC99_04155 [Deltaproteobacteria bacterium]|nr:hypothetical protein [Deltaproteobacteria bacterium]